MSSKDFESESASEEEDNVGGEDSGAMMSLFASYYGIEDTSGIASKSAAELIDSAHFNANKYVEELLGSQTAASLVAQDTSMIHEIRTLDSDMQMLVYENYNKFISATETIKRMKTNVEAMDDDMDAVRKKMVRITSTSKELDDSLAEKRTKVDKLVRVRRLLQKLEFLSELPEKLVELINCGQYKRAVQLYGKTINVLTNHAHLLSFKKIKERTEQMMRDLRIKVMNLLDDTNLEAVKLTHYVSILRMMDAPKDLVVGKLLTAHRNRSKRMMDEYCPVDSKSPLKGHQAYLATLTKPDFVHEYLKSVSTARQFHQTMMVGLMEAAKGISELYDLTKSFSESQTAAREEVEAYLKLQSLVDELSPRCMTCILQSLRAFFQKYNSLVHECRELEWQCALLAEKSAATTASSLATNSGNSSAGKVKKPQDDQNPFDDDDDDDVDNEPMESSENDVSVQPPVLLSEEERNLNQKLHDAQLTLYDLDEEKNAWLLLVRQALIDWEYLDNTVKKCYPSASKINLANGVASASDNPFDDDDEGAPTTAPPMQTLPAFVVASFVGQAENFAKELVAVLEKQTEHAFFRAVLRVVGSLRPYTSQVEGLVDLRAEVLKYRETEKGRGFSSNMSSHGMSSHGSGHGDQVTPRSILQKRTSETKVVVDSIIDAIGTGFGQLCAEIRPVYDIYSSATSKLLNSYADTAMLTWRFCSSVCTVLEALCGIRNASAEGIRYRQQRDLYSNSTSVEGEDIFGDLAVSATPWVGNLPSSSKKADSSIGTINGQSLIGRVSLQSSHVDDNSAYLARTWDALKESYVVRMAKTEQGVESTLSLTLSTAISTLSRTFVGRVQQELQAHELDRLDGNMHVKECCTSRLDVCAKSLLLEFTMKNSDSYSHRLIGALLNRRVRSGEEAGEYRNVIPEVLAIARSLEAAVVCCCIILGESPPALKAAAGEREFARRGSVKRTSTAGAGLQLDIERLFSQRIEIFKLELLVPTPEYIVSTVIKACLKGAMEALRFQRLRPTAYKGLQVDISFLKQLSGSLLRDASEVERLAELVVLALFSRYTEANDIASASDAGEAMMIANAVAEGITSMTNQTVLLTR